MKQGLQEKKSLIINGGEIGDYIRAFDWSQSSLGPMETWPGTLITTLNILLNCKASLFLFWGKDLICFYNDAYRPALGYEKHPGAIGVRGKEVWAEIWPTINPELEQVLGTGEAVWHEDVLLPILRNGQMVDTYWTYSYSPVYDGSQDPLGVFVTATETTEKVYGQRRLAESESNFRKLIMDAPVGITLLKGEDLVVTLANDLYLEIIGREREAFVGFPVWEVLAEAKNQGFDEILKQVMLTDTPYYASEQELKVIRNKRLETIYVNYTYQPVHDVKGNVNGVLAIVVEVTEMVNTRLRVEDLVTQRTAELQKANTQLAKSNMDLEQFAYVASHDLQEPLRKITAFGDLLKNRLTLGPGEQDLFDRMYSAVGRMQRLIDDLLTFSRVSIQGKQEVIDTNRLLAEVQTDLETIIKDKHAKITSEPLLPINGDPVQIRQLFQNLLSNAIKF